MREETREEGCILLGEVQGGTTTGWKELWPKTLQSPKEWDKYQKNADVFSLV